MLRYNAGVYMIDNMMYPGTVIYNIKLNPYKFRQTKILTLDDMTLFETFTRFPGSYEDLNCAPILCHCKCAIGIYHVYNYV